MNVETILKRKGTDVHTTPADASIAEIAERLRRHRIGALVVSADGRAVAGIISERDLVHGLAADGAALLAKTAGDLMTRDVATCSRDDEIADIMSLMTERRVRHVPVVEDGKLCGMVSIGDVVLSRIEEVERETEALKEYIVRG